MTEITYHLRREPDPIVTATGEHHYAFEEKTGRMFVMTPRRRKPFVCEAGVTHLRYWRSHGNSAAARSHFACEHNSVVQ